MEALYPSKERAERVARATGRRAPARWRHRCRSGRPGIIRRPDLASNLAQVIRERLVSPEAEW